jgi:superfamily I DNA/RNA helicase/mRNA-degrading endonuclease RelE of RelBE toxin-antitoxin system
MHFRIADTFTSSLAKLRNDEQKAVKQAAFDLQLNPAHPGLKFHRLDRAKDKDFWSVRVTRDIRLIVHKTSNGLLLCYVDHHDAAYRWAERRRLERHPTTGAAQLVEVRERVEEVVVPHFVDEPQEQARPPARTLFDDVSDAELLSYGVPEEWLDETRSATEDTLFDLAEMLPAEAAEALLQLATGGTPEPAVVAGASADPFAHPDAQRRFRVVADAAELQRALEYPWEKWSVFLHPSQREVVEARYNGPARVSGSAGTGKTVVALHRAAYLARTYPEANVLLTTFSTALARLLKTKADRLVGKASALRGRITVRSIDQVGLDIFAIHRGEPKLATPAMLRKLIRDARQQHDDCSFAQRFVEVEWANVIDAWQVDSWEAYRDIARMGRRSRLGEQQRATLWRVFATVRESLDRGGLVTMPMVFRACAEHVAQEESSRFGYAVVDEAQDVSVPQLRFLAALCSGRPDGLFFAGDLGQRIFQSPFSWKAIGVDVRGRSKTLRINYRTSQQIRQMADRLLPHAVTDSDGNRETRLGTTSVFSGPTPEIVHALNERDEIDRVSQWIQAQLERGVSAGELGVFVRSEDELPRARRAIEAAGARAELLSNDALPTDGNVALATMHLAKGHEYRAVAVMACDDEVIPNQARIESVSDESELELVWTTERHLLYVACTRARDALMVSGVEPVSEFVEDCRK